MRPAIFAGDLPIAYSRGDEKTAQVVAAAAEAALGLAAHDWDLPAPRSCRVYVMTSWRGFFFEAAPPVWKALLALTYPIWAARARRLWPYSAGWTLRFGRRIAVGIKPPRLIAVSDKSIGARMFIEEPDPIAKIRHITCHELIHAASSHLRLPAWLNEGLAAVSVDRFMGKPTILDESLDLLERIQPKGRPPSNRAMARLHAETLAYHAVRGYWIVRLLEDRHPGFVRSLLAARQSSREIERQVAQRLGLSPAGLWRAIDAEVIEHFRRERD